jgi:hypothetical protein
MRLNIVLSDYLAVTMKRTNNPLAEQAFAQLVNAARSQDMNVLVVDDFDGSPLFRPGAHSQSDEIGG